MLNHQTLQTLRSLRLPGMADGLEQQLAQPNTHSELGFEERLALLVDRETTYRQNNKIARLLKAAKLKLQAPPENIDYRHPRGLQRSQIDSDSNSRRRRCSWRRPVPRQTPGPRGFHPCPG